MLTGGSVDADDPRFAAFADLCDGSDLHGLAFQHLKLCRRRAWLHMNRIDYAHLEPRMALGQVSHDLSRARDHSVSGLIGLAPDRIDWKRRVVIEAKGSAGAVGAVSCQTAFYALMLTARTGLSWSARTEIISQRKSRDVAIDDAMLTEMMALARALCDLRDEPGCPPAEPRPICASCSYRHLCWRS